MSLINRLAFAYNDNPALTTDGLLWFKDLTSPDPTGIMPIVGSLITLLNLMTTSTSTSSPTARKMRRYLFILPLMSAPIWMTFPAVSVFKLNFQAFNLYWIFTGLTQLTLINVFRSERMKNFMGVPDYLPDTELERLN